MIKYITKRNSIEFRKLLGRLIVGVNMLKFSDFFTSLSLFLANYFSNIPEKLRPYRYFGAALFVASTLFFAVGIPKFQLDSSLETWLPKGDPSIKALEKFKTQFGSDDGVFIVYRAKDNNIFSPSSLKTLRKLTQDLENWNELNLQELGLEESEIQGLSRILDVQSLANERYEIDDGESLISRYIIPKSSEITEELAKKIAEISLNQKSLKLLMFSEDATFGGIVLKTDFGAVRVLDNGENLDSTEVDQLDNALDDFEIEVDETIEIDATVYEPTLPDEYSDLMLPLNRLLAKYSSEFEFYPVGTAPMTDMAYEILGQAGILAMVALLVVILLLFSLFKSGSAVLWTVTCIASCTIWVFGGMSWIGIPSTQLVALTVMLVFGVGIADCVHVLSEYTLFRKRGLNHKEAIKMAYQKTGVPILLTSITTMAAMIVIALGGIGHFVTFGISSAIGVFLAFLFTLYVFPILLEFWHPYKSIDRRKSNGPHRYSFVSVPVEFLGKVFYFLGLRWLLTAEWLPGLLALLPHFSFKFRFPIIFCFLFLLALCGLGLSRITIDTNLLELFKEDTKLIKTYNIVDQKMAGTGSMEIMIDLKKLDGFTDIDVLETVSKFQELMEKKYQSHVVRTYSLSDIVMDVNKTLGGSNGYSLPESSTAVVQLLSLFNNSNPDKRRRIVSDDYSQSHITIQLLNASSKEYNELFEDLEADLEKAMEPLRSNYPEMEYGVTGTYALMLQMGEVVSKSQYRSLALAVIVISAILLITLGSVSGGILSIIPNILPTVSAFGLMGLLGIPLDTDTLMIAPLIIGIAVDDTIHFVTHYRMNLSRGNSVGEALKHTIDEVGRAVTFTTLILGVSFLLLGFSDYIGIARVGIFGSFAIFVALICDLLFLPALVHVFQPKFGVNKQNKLSVGS